MNGEKKKSQMCVGVCMHVCACACVHKCVHAHAFVFSPHSRCSANLGFYFQKDTFMSVSCTMNTFSPCPSTVDLSYHQGRDTASTDCFVIFLFYTHANTACVRAATHFQISLTLVDVFPHGLLLSIQLSDSISSTCPFLHANVCLFQRKFKLYAYWVTSSTLMLVVHFDVTFKIHSLSEQIVFSNPDQGVYLYRWEVYSGYIPTSTLGQCLHIPPKSLLQFPTPLCM